MRRRVRLDPDHAADILQRLPPAPKRVIRQALRELAEDPTGLSNGLDIKELDRAGGRNRAFRLRAGDWRVGFLLLPKEIQAVKILHRREGYDWLDDMP